MTTLVIFSKNLPLSCSKLQAISVETLNMWEEVSQSDKTKTELFWTKTQKTNTAQDPGLNTP